MAKKKSAGLSIGGDFKADAGGDVNVAGGDITTGGLTFQADWRDSAMSALGEANANPAQRSAIERRLDAIEEELGKDKPEAGTISTFVGDIERIMPAISNVLRLVLPFVK